MDTQADEHSISSNWWIYTASDVQLRHWGKALDSDGTVQRRMKWSIEKKNGSSCHWAQLERKKILALQCKPFLFFLPSRGTRFE